MAKTAITLVQKTALIILAFALLFCSLAYPLGAGPPEIDVPYTPGETQNYQFIVVNKNPEPVTVEIGAGGELASSITVNQSEALIPGASSGVFEFDIIVPGNLTPGMHKITYINIREKPPDAKGGSVGAVVGVGLTVLVFVPYPQKYLEVSIDAQNYPVDSPITVSATAINRGNEDVDAEATILIYDSSGAKVAQASAGAKTVRIGKSETFSADLEGISTPGNYLAMAEIRYGGETRKAEKKFKIGDMSVVIGSITTDVAEGAIGSISISLESFWSENIPNVYADIKINDGRGTTISTPSIGLPKWGKGTLSGYWNTKDNGIKAGNYNADIIVYYGNKTATKSIIITVRQAGTSAPAGGTTAGTAETPSGTEPAATTPSAGASSGIDMALVAVAVVGVVGFGGVIVILLAAALYMLKRQNKGHKRAIAKKKPSRGRKKNARK